MMKIISLSLIAIATTGAIASAIAAPASGHSASLTQEPVVMRLSKDEFRIAFGINSERCAATGCNGVIHYRVDWKAEDGMTRSESRRVSYEALPSMGRSITVDRQYFDTAEGAHKTDVVKVSVNKITCLDGVEAPAVRTASNAARAVPVMGQSH
jgi:hypothetical protein